MSIGRGKASRPRHLKKSNATITNYFTIFLQIIDVQILTNSNLEHR